MATPASTSVRTSRRARPPAHPETDPAPMMLDPERRRALIAEAAYFRAQRRGFAPGFETEDWLSAESEVDTALTAGLLTPRS